MKRALFAVAVLALMAYPAVAVDNDGHDVTITVSAINEVNHDGGNITMIISAAVPGSPPTAVTDATCDLDYTTNATSGADKRITGALSSAYGTGVTLKVTASDPGGSGAGASAGQVTLGAAAASIITDIYTSTVNDVTLTYEASATVSAAITSETRTVTYTMVDDV